jgi:hypothetical protein
MGFEFFIYKGIFNFLFGGYGGAFDFKVILSCVHDFLLEFFFTVTLFIHSQGIVY